MTALENKIKQAAKQLEKEQWDKKKILQELTGSNAGSAEKKNR